VLEFDDNEVTADALEYEGAGEESDGGGVKQR
jgi:hypothetical protein